MQKELSAALQARIEGAVAKAKQTPVINLVRINWDLPENAQLRERLADSWVNKQDLYKQGESLTRFAQRNGIDRNVLQRFLQHKHGKNKNNLPQRGRRAYLSRSVIHHLCEGKCISMHN